MLEALTALQKLREAMLLPTLFNAAKTPFYQSLWQGIDLDACDLKSLSKLPLVTKAQIRQAGKEAQNREGLICNEIFTSGTTGPPLVTVRGNREQEYISRFFSRVWAEPALNTMPRGLQFNSPYHGYSVAIPTPVHFHHIGIYDRGSFDYGRSILMERHEDAGVDPYCTILVGLEGHLRAFAYDTVDKFGSTFRSRLKAVVTYAQYVTRRTRALLETAFGCPVIDRFGMSEVFGGARQSLECGWYHFDPVVIPEVIASDGSGELVKEGMGILVLTPLFPFQESQPLVRYVTGDLVETTFTRSSRPGQLAIKPLGRARYGVPDGPDWVLTPAAVYEVVDNMPQVQRTPIFRDASQVTDPYRLGHPKYRIENSMNSGRVEIRIQLVVAEINGNGRLAVAEKLHEQLRRENPKLQSKLSDDSVRLAIELVDDLDPHDISHAE